MLDLRVRKYFDRVGLRQIDINKNNDGKNSIFENILLLCNCSFSRAKIVMVYLGFTMINYAHDTFTNAIVILNLDLTNLLLQLSV